MRTTDGRLICLAGASRSGKSLYASQIAADHPRAYAWDIEGQWANLPGWRRIETRADLARAADDPRPIRWAYVAPPNAQLRDSFEFFARCAFHAIDQHGPALIVAEELADVTTTAKAPPAWGALCRRGLKRGASIIAISQRWAEADKTAIGNASEIVALTQASDADSRYLADRTRIPLAQLRNLVAEFHPNGRPKSLPFIRYDTRTKTASAGNFRFSAAGRMLK